MDYSGVAYLFQGSASGLVTVAATTLAGESGGDYFGYAVSKAGDVNHDGYDDVVVGAFGVNSRAGRAYVYQGSASGLASTTALTLSGETVGDGLGGSVSAAGDVNGDGYDDVLIGAPYASSYTGRVYLYEGSATGLSTAPGATVFGEATRNYFGVRLSGAGDVNHDGYDDILIGANGYGDPDPLSWTGELWS